MKKQLMVGLTAATLLIGLAVSVNAGLVASGTVNYAGANLQLIYDTDLNITWLDYVANYATKDVQQAWATNLSLTVNGVTYNNWRLPSTVDDSAAYTQTLPSNYWYSGAYSYGFNNTTSEMGHLFYTELGNKGSYGTNGEFYGGYTITGEYYDDTRVLNYSPFASLVPYSGYYFWSGTDAAANPGVSWIISLQYGNQGLGYSATNGLALAVHPGLVGTAAVPLPATVLLFGAGVIGIVGLNRKFRK